MRGRAIGLAKTKLQHLLTAVAINFLRIGEWLSGTPRAQTRPPPPSPGSPPPNEC